MSNIPEASEIPSRYHGSDLLPRKYESKSFAPRRETQRPIRITVRK